MTIELEGVAEGARGVSDLVNAHCQRGVAAPAHSSPAHSVQGVQCTGTKRDGTPCGSRIGVSPTTQRCLNHDPERTAQLRASRSAGGVATKAARRAAKASGTTETKALAVPPMPETLDDASKIASWITYHVLAGEIDARTAEAATKAVRQFQLTEEKRALTAEIAALRAELAQAKLGLAVGTMPA